ncbi:Asp-tRNA(Asn)/Glu-tRNA(Gln) amidotransferase subunit GatC [bacterium]|nr:Asp-tRNA(Asn)/Glu-tRNA(Gln) amidotransferase subunit GatC [bacterium]
MSELTTEQVAHVAKLARLDLSQQEIEGFRKDLSSIVDYVERLRQVDLSTVPATLGVQPHTNVLRADEARPSLGPDGVLANAPKREQNAFQIPRILEEA